MVINPVDGGWVPRLLFLPRRRVQLLLFPLLAGHVVILIVLEGAILDAAVLLVHQMGLVPGLRLAGGPQGVDDRGDHEDGERHPEDHAPLHQSGLDSRTEGISKEWAKGTSSTLTSGVMMPTT